MSDFSLHPCDNTHMGGQLRGYERLLFPDCCSAVVNIWRRKRRANQIWAEQERRGAGVSRAAACVLLTSPQTTAEMIKTLHLNKMWFITCSRGADEDINPLFGFTPAPDAFSEMYISCHDLGLLHEPAVYLYHPCPSTCVSTWDSRLIIHFSKLNCTVFLKTTKLAIFSV